MFVKKCVNISLFLFQIALSIILILSFTGCKKNSTPTFSEHTYSIDKEPVFIQQILPEKSQKKETGIVIFVLASRDENIEEVKKALDSFLVDGYILNILLADWGSVFQKYLNSSSRKDNEGSFCNLVNSINSGSNNRKVFLLSGKLGCFSYIPPLQSDCVDGLVLLSPYCEQNNSDNDHFLLFTPTIILVGENDEKSYNFSLQLYQKNRSLCEMRTYPTDDSEYNLINQSIHAKEQIKLWIKTITAREN